MPDGRRDGRPIGDLKHGLEPGIFLALDPMSPAAGVARIPADFARAFPATVLTAQTEPLGGVLELVRKGTTQFGLSAILIEWPDEMDAVTIDALSVVPVAAPGHPLTQGSPTLAAMREDLQLVLTDRSGFTDDYDMATHAVRTWHFTDLAMKLAVLRSGVGWAHMPLHLAADDLASGSLRRLSLPILPGGSMPYTLLRRRDAALSYAGRWLVEKFAERRVVTPA